MSAIITIRLEKGRRVLYMVTRKELKIKLGRIIFGCFFVIIGVLGTFFGVAAKTQEVYAIPEETTIVDNNDREVQPTGENSVVEETTSGEVIGEGYNGDGCKDSLGAIGWLVCPTTGKIAEAVDWLYDKIEEILIINPVSVEDGSPIYEIWKYCLSCLRLVSHSPAQVAPTSR